MRKFLANFLAKNTKMAPKKHQKINEGLPNLCRTSTEGLHTTNAALFKFAQFTKKHYLCAPKIVNNRKYSNVDTNNATF